MLKGALSPRVTSRLRLRERRAACGRNQVSGTSAVNPKSSLQGLKILVIDDSKTIRRTAETLLAKEGARSYRR